jgi:hypothetical protein
MEPKKLKQLLEIIKTDGDCPEESLKVVTKLSDSWTCKKCVFSEVECKSAENTLKIAKKTMKDIISAT